MKGRKYIVVASIAMVLLLSLSVNVQNAEASEAQNLDILFDFNDGRQSWVTVVGEGSVFEATMAAAEILGYEIVAEDYGFGHFIVSIDGITDLWWSLWIWNSTNGIWSPAMTGADDVPAGSAEAVCWKLEKDWWPIEPVATPEYRYPWVDMRNGAQNSGSSTMYFRIAANVTAEVDLGSGSIDTTPLSANGTLYIFASGNLWMGESGLSPSLLSLDEFGNELWSVDTEDTMYEISTPCIIGDKIIVGSTCGNISAFDRNNGSALWMVKITNDTNGISSSLGQYRTDIIATTGDGNVSRLFSENGTAIWTTNIGEKIYYSKPAVGNGTLAVGSDSGNIVFIDVTNGSIICSMSLGERIRSSPAYHRSSGYYFVTAKISDDHYSAFAVTPTQGIIWEIDLPQTTASPVLLNDSIFFAGSDFVKAFDLEGNIIWSTEINGEIKGSPVVLDGWLYMATNEADGKIYCIDSEDGHIIWQKKFPGGDGAVYFFAPPSISDGGLAVAGGDGKLRIFADEYIEQKPWVVLNSSYEAYIGENITITPVKILDNNSNPLSVWYDFGDGACLKKANSSEDFSVIHFYSEAGIFELTIYVDDGMGNNVSSTAQVTIRDENAFSINSLFIPMFAAGAIAIIAIFVFISLRKRKNIGELEKRSDEK